MKYFLYNFFFGGAEAGLDFIGPRWECERKIDDKLAADCGKRFQPPAPSSSIEPSEMPDLPLPCPVWNQSSQPTSQSKEHNISLPKGYGPIRFHYLCNDLSFPRAHPFIPLQTKGYEKGDQREDLLYAFISVLVA